jgi:hypothetical protein
LKKYWSRQAGGAFAQGLSEEADLEAAVDAFCEYCEMSEDQNASFKEALFEITKNAFDKDDVSDDEIRGFFEVVFQAIPQGHQDDSQQGRHGATCR